MTRAQALSDRLQRLDRRWLFLAMAIAVVVPLLVPMTLPFRPSAMVTPLYDEIERLPPGTRVLFSADYDPATKPELYPFAKAVLRHLLRKRARVVFVTWWDKGPPMVRELVRSIVEEEYNARRGPFAARPAGDPDYEAGRDWAFLGYKEGKQIAIAIAGQDLRRQFPVDAEGTPLGRLPVMDGVQSLRDFPLIVNVSGGFPGAKEYVEQVVSRYGLRFAAATTAVSITDLAPYYPKHIFALVGGMRGAAEYEQLVGVPELGTAGLNVLTFGQLMVVLAIVLGNVIYFLGRRGPRRGGR